MRGRRDVINPKAIALAFVVGGTMTVSGGLVAAGVFDGASVNDRPAPVAGRSGAAAPSTGAKFALPPAAPLDGGTASDDGPSGLAQLTPSDTPTQAPPTPTQVPPTQPPPPPTATQPPAPTQAPPTQPPPPTATQPPAPTQPPPTQPPPPPTATQPPAPPATQPPPPPTQPPPVTAPPPPPQSASLHPMESAMFQSHNAQRANAGVGALAIDGALVGIARQRSQTMAASNCFSHTACGATAFQLMGSIGYFYQIAGENIARNNYPDSESVQVAMTGFMNSPGHRANIVDGRFTKVGIGVAFDGNGMKYFTVIFAGP